MKTLLFNVIKVRGKTKEHPYQALQHPGSVAILPVRETRKNGLLEVLLIRQFRSAVNVNVWEAPAGTMDVPGENPKDCAARELIEETGLQAGKISHIGQVFASPGYSTEVIQLYIAQELTKVGETEHGVVSEWIELSKIAKRIRSGVIKDSKTIVLLRELELNDSKYKAAKCP